MATVYSEELKAVMDDFIGTRSLSDVAAQCGCDPSVLSRMRRWGKVVERETCAQIADGLQLSGRNRRRLFAACGYVEMASTPEVAA